MRKRPWSWMLGLGSVALLSVSGGGAVAAACAADNAPSPPKPATYLATWAPTWSTARGAGRAPHVLQVARHAPAFGGWYLGRLATVARREPGLFLRLVTSEMPAIDRRALA